MNKFQVREEIEKDLEGKLETAVKQAEEVQATIRLNEQWLASWNAKIEGYREALNELRGIKPAPVSLPERYV